MDIAWHCILVKEHWLYNFTACQSVNLVMTISVFFSTTLLLTADNRRYNDDEANTCGGGVLFPAKGELVDIPPIC